MDSRVTASQCAAYSEELELSRANGDGGCGNE